MPDLTVRRRSAGLVAGLALALVASACASGGSDPAARPSGAQVSSAPPATQSPATDGDAGDGGGKGTPTEPAVVPEILDFEAPLVGGGTLKGAELAGAPVAVWFWAPW